MDNRLDRSHPWFHRWYGRSYLGNLSFHARKLLELCLRKQHDPELLFSWQIHYGWRRTEGWKWSIRKTEESSSSKVTVYLLVQRVHDHKAHERMLCFMLQKKSCLKQTRCKVWKTSKGNWASARWAQLCQIDPQSQSFGVHFTSPTQKISASPCLKLQKILNWGYCWRWTSFWQPSIELITPWARSEKQEKLPVYDEWVQVAGEITIPCSLRSDS